MFVKHDENSVENVILPCCVPGCESIHEHLHVALTTKYMNAETLCAILSVEQETIVGNVNLASNDDCNHGAIIRIYGV